jgi:GNAT superfamily N-acetyltransferase
MPQVSLRDYRPGDLGFVVGLHARTYSRLLGLGLSFEALIAREVAEFLERMDPAGERFWVAANSERPVGTITVQRGEAGEAWLRWFVVEQECRGRGLGHRLLDAAIDFARRTGNRRLSLWTAAGLDASARLYAQNGFVRMKSETDDRWGGRLEAVQLSLDLD